MAGLARGVTVAYLLATRGARAEIVSLGLERRVVEYEHNGARVRQPSEIGPDLTALLAKLGIPLPPKLHAVAAAPSVTAAPSAA
ncbi:MAG TPA: hypothetical protein VH165_05130 [Kofleriaceae bacterium]|nr:hypothetical protein [Kofleriaceae bacterium]